MSVKFKLAICQMCVTDDKSKNIEKAIDMLAEAADNGADVAALPEMFNCPYDSGKFKDYGEDENCGETVRSVSETAKALGIYVVAGSIPEYCDGRLYNTSFVFGRSGEIIARHRKVHLFDIDVPGKIRFMESETLAAGNKITVTDTDFCRIGIAICYDMRFPELIRLMALKEAVLIIVPAAFNMVTGPAHWEILVRSRAVDNQVYMAAAAPARNEAASYVSYGHSMIAAPWGNIISAADEKERIIYGLIDTDEVEQARSRLPLLRHRREDVYGLKEI